MNPYRRRSARPDPEGPSFDRAAAYRAGRMRLAVASVLVLAGAVAVPFVARTRRPPRARIPAPVELLTSSSAFPAALPVLPPSVPLDPLLAADAPDRLALVEPTETALNVRPGEPVRVRFNRPMVDGARVGKPGGAEVLAFEPAVQGRGTWTSRSSYGFEPAATTWTATRTVTMTLAPSLRSLAGEAVAEVEGAPRTVVFDAGPRFVRTDRGRRLLPGEPLRLLFSGKVDTGALPSQLLVYEVNGGQRMIPFSVSQRALDARGLTPVELALKRTLEPGAHLAVALAPPIAYGGSHPRVVELDLSPRPRIEGIACAADATEASQCAFTGPPEAVVDVEESLILLASTELGEPKADAVETRPALDAMALKVEGGRRLSIRGDWIPGQVYEVRVGKLADKEGHPLARTAPLAVRSAGRAPEVRVAQGRLSFERGAKTMLSIQGIHVEDGEVRLGAVPPGREIEAVLSPARWLDEVMGAARASLPLHPLLPTSRPNRWGRGALDWRAATRADMAVIAMVPAPLRPLPAGGHAAPAATFVQRSDLGIDAMILPEGALVWVTSVASAEPVAGADVTVAPRPAEPPGPAEQEPSSVDGRTDERGVAWIPLASTAFLERGAAVRATHADDRAVLLVDPRSSMGPRHLGVSAGAAPPPADAWRATVFTDRGICRPGETIHAKATVRTSIDGAWVSAVSGDARLLLMGPSGQAPLAERLVALSAFGTADADFVVDGAAGTYRVEVRVPGQEAPAGSVSFEVGEYRPPSLRVDLTTTVAKLDDGDPLRMGIVARHFFGPPAAGMRAQWTLTREPDGEYPDAWEAFIFGPADATSRAGTVATGDVVLDGDGRASVETKVALGAPLRETALFSVSVRDLSGLTTTARRRVHTYPATFEVGLRRAPHWIEPGVALDLDAVVIDHEGAPQAGRTVEARILREGWHTYWEWSGHARHDDAEADEGAEPEARFQPRHARRAEVAHRCKLTSAAEPVRCAWTPDRPGTYLLEATTRDERGRTSTASERVYVAGPDEHPDRDRPGAALALTPAKRSLDTGETAEVAFESPFPDAEALLVVAREGVIHTEARRVSAGGNVLRFPVTAAMVPNAFVSLSLVRPRTGPPGRKIDLDAPDLRVGMAEIAVRPAAAPLAVKIEIAGESAPAGSDVPVAVSVLDEEGKGVPAEVALFAVDEGTLRVTGYETPDATADLFSRRPAAFAWEDLRRSLVSRVDLPLPPGGDGDGKSERSRPRDEQERFDPTPLWVGRLATDAEGKVSAVLHLPARPAQYRVMAVAVDAGVRAGHAERPITAAMPLVLRPVLPPFVTEGDRFQAVVFVHDTEDAPADVTVTAFVDGAARPSSPIHLEGKGEARVAEPIEAGSTGEVRVRFEVRSDRASAVVEKHIAVAARGRAVRSEAAFAVEGSREITVALPEPAEGRGAVTLSVARHPFVGFDTALETLLASPDEGTEPTASSVIALAAYTALDTGKRPGSVSAAELGARASQAIARLAALQAPSGGWGSFTRNDPPDGYLSAYALHALLSARRAGFTVPAAAVDGAVSHLGELARGTAFLDEKREDDLAFALRVLAEGGARDDDRNKALFDQRERLSPFGLAQLGLALATDDRRRDTLVLDAARRVLATADDEQHDPRVLRWYDGSARTLGAVLEAAIGTDVAAAQVAPLAGKLLATRAGAEAGWWSTHETSHALAALAAYAATLTFAEPLAPRVTLDGMPLGAAEQGPALSWYTLPASAGRGSHVLRIEVEGTAFFALSAGWTVPLGPDDAVARGEAAALHRVFEDATGKPLGPDAHVRLGDLVRVRLFLYSEHETPPFLAIRDRLAGGLEPLDAAHETSPRESLWALLGMGPDDDAVDVRGARAARSLDLVSHRAFLPAQAVFYLQKGTTGLQEVTYGVRATTPGTWVLPPAELDALYAPRFQARSAQATITVDP